MRLYPLDWQVLRFRPKAAEFINAYSTNTLDRPHNAFVDVRGRIVAVFEQVKISADEVLVALGRPFTHRVVIHLAKYLDLAGVSAEETPLSVYWDLDGGYEPREEEKIIPQAAGRLILTPARLDASVSEEDFARFRLAHRLPLQGVDFDDELLLDVFDESHVSYTKGCYLGQEIIARVHFRGEPPKRLSVVFEDVLDASARGVLTSKAADPATGRVSGFSFLKK